LKSSAIGNEVARQRLQYGATLSRRYCDVLNCRVTAWTAIEVTTSPWRGFFNATDLALARA